MWYAIVAAAGDGVGAANFSGNSVAGVRATVTTVPSVAVGIIAGIGFGAHVRLIVEVVRSITGAVVRAAVLAPVPVFVSVL